MMPDLSGTALCRAVGVYIAVVAFTGTTVMCVVQEPGTDASSDTGAVGARYELPMRFYVGEPVTRFSACADSGAVFLTEYGSTVRIWSSGRCLTGTSAVGPAIELVPGTEYGLRSDALPDQVTITGFVPVEVTVPRPL